MQAEGDVVGTVAQEGPPDFATFFADEHPGLLKLLYFVTGNRADAAELMEDAFLKAVGAVGQDRPDRRPPGVPVPRGAEGVPDAGVPHAGRRGGW